MLDLLIKAAGPRSLVPGHLSTPNDLGTLYDQPERSLSPSQLPLMKHHILNQPLRLSFPRTTSVPNCTRKISRACKLDGGRKWHCTPPG